MSNITTIYHQDIRKATLELLDACKLKRFVKAGMKVSFKPNLVMAKAVRIGEECTNCGLCVSLCPTKNLGRKGGTMIPLRNCTLCYRCVNHCPQKAIRIMSKSKTRWQYRADKMAL